MHTVFQCIRRQEVETINNVRDLLKKTLEQSIKQQQANRDRKHELEMDWSDKLEARQRDHWCGNLKNTSPNIMFHPGASHFQVNGISFEVSVSVAITLLE